MEEKMFENSAPLNLKVSRRLTQVKINLREWMATISEISVICGRRKK